MDLEEKYKEETGFDVGKIHDIGSTYYSNDYVEWLEKQLILTKVNRSLQVDIPKFLDWVKMTCIIDADEWHSLMHNWNYNSKELFDLYTQEQNNQL